MSKIQSRFIVIIGAFLFLPVMILLVDTHLGERRLHRMKSLSIEIRKKKFLLVLATTWNLSTEKLEVYKNTAHIWSSWPLSLQPILFRSEVPSNNIRSSQLDMYLRRNWKIQKVLKVGCGQIPVLKSMILDVLESFTGHDYYGYANADILFDQSLLNTLESIKKKTPQNKPLLVIGQRTNVNFTNHKYVVNTYNIRDIAENGQLARGIAVDYFITNQHFPWNQILDFVVGRSRYDNWLVSFANSQNMTVIDATKTLIAVHQTTRDGNHAGWHKPNKYCNANIIKASGKKSENMGWGYAGCAPYYTKKNRETNEIELLYRKVPRSCKIINVPQH